MKYKMFSAFLVMMTMFVGIVGALGLPQPYVVHVSANTYTDAIGVEVIVRDVTHPFTVVTKTNEYGEAAGDWSAADVAGKEGDVFEIEVNGVVYPASMTNAGIQDINGKDIIQVNIGDSYCPPKNECPEQVTCPADTTPYSLETCPEKTVYPNEYEISQKAEQYVIDHPDMCSGVAEEGYGITTVILAILASIGVGSGIALSIHRDGKTGKLIFSIKSHRHYGRETLHSIYTVHRAPYTHGYGEPIPVYLNGKYVQNEKYPMK